MCRMWSARRSVAPVPAGIGALALAILAGCDSPSAPASPSAARSTYSADVSAAIRLGLDTSRYWYSAILERRIDVTPPGSRGASLMAATEPGSAAPAIPAQRRRELRRLTTGRTAAGEALTEVMILLDSTTINDEPAPEHQKSQVARLLVQGADVRVFDASGRQLNSSRVGGSSNLLTKSSSIPGPSPVGAVLGGISTSKARLLEHARAEGATVSTRGSIVTVDRDVRQPAGPGATPTQHHRVEEFEEDAAGRATLMAYGDVSVGRGGTRLSTMTRVLARAEAHVERQEMPGSATHFPTARRRAVLPARVVQPTSAPRTASALGGCDTPPTSGSVADVQLVFVHGIWSDCSTWSTMIDRATSTYKASAYGISTPAMAALGLQAGMVDEARATGGNALGKDQILVGHSQGGLIAREAYRMSHPAYYPPGYSRPPVTGIMTIDTPHTGADINILGQFLGPWLAELGFAIAADNCIHWESGYGEGGGGGGGGGDQQLSIEDFANGSWYASASCFAMTALAPLAFQTFFEVWPVSQTGTPLGALGDNYPGAPFITTLNSSSEPVPRAGITNVIPLPGSALRMMYEMLFHQDGAFIQLEAQAQAEWAQLMQWNALRVGNLMGNGISPEQEEIIGFWTGMVNFFVVVDVAWAAVTGTWIDGGDGFIRRSRQWYAGEGFNPRNEENVIYSPLGSPANSHIWATKGLATWEQADKLMLQHFQVPRR